jgi:hypothetical protein
MNIIFLEVHLPGQPPALGGFVLIDRPKQRACVRFRHSWDPTVDPIDAEVLSGTSQVIDSLFDTMSFDEAVRLVSELSNVVRATSELHIPAAFNRELLADSLSALLLR